MLEARWIPYRLHFKTKARTSRSVMTDKETFYVVVRDTVRPDVTGIGECALFRGLSADDTADYESILNDCCNEIDTLDVTAVPSSSIRFGLETALSDLANGGSMRPMAVDDSWRIKINGLVWMADKDTMSAQAAQKIADGFDCVKLKIGGIDFEQEIDILRHLRRHFPADILEIRLDANGAFTPQSALTKLERLSRFDIHSIEQPIRQGQPGEMARVCRESPIAIALDEELIGLTDTETKRELLGFIRPRYVILKPSLCGGFREADDWIAIAESQGIGWWATSALESNVGLNAIARWISTKATSMPQGLGTGMLYTDNIPSPLMLDGDRLCCNKEGQWETRNIISAK